MQILCLQMSVLWHIHYVHVHVRVHIHYIIVITLTLQYLFRFCTWSFVINIHLVSMNDHATMIIFDG